MAWWWSVADSSEKPVTKAKAPPHEPTDAQRAEVQRMAQIGLPQSDIALVIGISESTLKRKYSLELKKGGAEGKVGVLTTLHRQAMGTPAEYDKGGKLLRAEVKPNAIVGIFLGKTRCGLVEKTSHEVTGKGGKPIQHEAKIRINVAPEDLEV